MDREELGGKGELEKGGEVKRSQEPGVRGVEEDKEGDGCFGGVPCKKKKKSKASVRRSAFSCLSSEVAITLASASEH